MFQFVKMYYKWTTARGISADTPHIKALFSETLLQSAQVDNEGCRGILDLDYAPLNRLKKLMKKHFYANKEADTRKHSRTKCFNADSI